MELQQLVAILNQKLEPWRFKDYAPNGLQVEGRSQVRHVVAGVTASQALLDEAVRLKADAILVHHGYFWKSESAAITGIKRQRIATLLQSDISLLAYHLPLDAHPELGNNAQLGRLLGIVDAAPSADEPLLWQGQLSQEMEVAAFATQLSMRLEREPLVLGPADRKLRRLAWCTGGAQGYFEQAIAMGGDAFLTGEVSEQNHHLAQEYGVTFIAAGHHATERYGVKALGEWLAAEHALQVSFVDLFNPV
ncbi:Nif3-like dinuclear metal center hexameric protein [Vogesella sp. LIG4]|uniref:Nif3-like dinuclear metal center hexameric protein n=1 Tax=Vogesella sp. LIG4 TaxID=1192162 RepID=UPI00081FB5A3|nr:Nif3-like dinuclear metal center hexameric protein [Vogesella sp. LIG4]SCK09307.1 dinuclear metal center protein, YbgI/SA1388 family [Vogesella sp. LIG4]